MGHAEVSEAPGQRGYDGQESVGTCCPRGSVIPLEDIEITGKRARICRDIGHSAGFLNSEKDYDDQGDRHKDALHKVRGGDREESAEYCVRYDNDRAKDHSSVIINSEKAVEQCSYCLESGSRVRNEEYKNDERCDQ